MLTNSDGSRIDADTRYPNKGIIRGTSSNSQCIYVDAWNAYKCEDMNHKMLIMESLDADTETRRLSPIAVASEGYIDLINGPQDHGWCHGYTCQERISTFNIIVSTGKHYEIFLTSYNPQKTRFRLIDVNETETVSVEIYYPKPQRLDVYRKSKYLLSHIEVYYVELTISTLLVPHLNQYTTPLLRFDVYRKSKFFLYLIFASRFYV